MERVALKDGVEYVGSRQIELVLGILKGREICIFADRDDRPKEVRVYRLSHHTNVLHALSLEDGFQELGGHPNLVHSVHLLLPSLRKAVGLKHGPTHMIRDRFGELRAVARFKRGRLPGSRLAVTHFNGDAIPIIPILVQQSPQHGLILALNQAQNTTSYERADK